MHAAKLALTILVAAAGTPLYAQSPDAALSAQWNAVCAGAGGQLALRCAEIFAGGPGSRDIAAVGNTLDEIPGQGRAATRDGAPEDAMVSTELAAGWSLFASVDSGRLRRRDGINEAPFDGDTGSISAGIDWMPAQRWQVGLLLNHARDDLDFLGSGGSMRTRFTGLMLVAGWMPTDTWALDAYAGRLDGDYDVRRAIAYTLPDATRIDTVANASMGATRDLFGGGVTFSPATGAWQWQFGAGFDWQSTQIDPYREEGGSGFAIAVPGREVVSRRGRLDATLARTLSTSWGVWQPTATLGWRHEFANPSRPVRITFLQDANATPVVFDTDDADATWGEFGFGAVFVFAGGHSAFVEYRQRFSHDFLQERILSLGWRMEL